MKPRAVTIARAAVNNMQFRLPTLFLVMLVLVTAMATPGGIALAVFALLTVASIRGRAMKRSFLVLEFFLVLSLVGSAAALIVPVADRSNAPADLPALVLRWAVFLCAVVLLLVHGLVFDRRRRSAGGTETRAEAGQ